MYRVVRYLAPLVLSLCLGALLFLYWRESNELQRSLMTNNQLRRELTTSRSERDQVQFKLNLLQEDMNTAQKESERQIQGLDEQLQENERLLRQTRVEFHLCQSDLESMKSNVGVCKDTKETLEEIVDQLRTQVNGCELENKEISAVNARSQHEQQVLKEEINRKKLGKDDLLQQLNGVETERSVCEKALSDCNTEIQRLTVNERNPPPVPMN